MTNNNNKMNSKSVWLRSSTPRRLPVTPLCLSCLVAAASTRRAESPPQNSRSNCALLPRLLAFCAAFPPVSRPVSLHAPSLMLSLPATPFYSLFRFGATQALPQKGRFSFFLGDGAKLAAAAWNMRAVLSTSCEGQTAGGSATPAEHVFLRGGGRCQL